MEKKMFCFKKSWRDALTGLPDQVRLEVYDAVIEYGLSGKLPSLKSRADVAFRFIKQDIDAIKDFLPLSEAGDRRSLTSAENGKKGGRGRKAKVSNTETKENQPNPKVSVAETKPNKPILKPNKPILKPNKPNSDLGLFPVPTPSRAHVVADNNIFNNNINIKNNNQKIEKESQKKESEKSSSEKPVNSANDLKLSKAADYDTQAFIDFFNNELVKANSVIPALQEAYGQTQACRSGPRT